MQAQQAGDGEFAFEYVMVDKAKAEMAAITSISAKYLLCYFHLLQDWERFLRSAASGVRSLEDRHGIMCSLRKLKEQRNEALFQHEVSRYWWHVVLSFMQMLVEKVL